MERPIWASFFDPPHYFGRPVECIAEDAGEEASRREELYANETAVLAKRVEDMISSRS